MYISSRSWSDCRARFEFVVSDCDSSEQHDCRLSCCVASISPGHQLSELLASRSAAVNFQETHPSHPSLPIMEVVSLFRICLLCLLPISSQAVITVNLTGTWDVINPEKGINVKGQVPGSMYTALVNSKVIPDPYYRDNDDKYRWVASADWAFSNTFQLDASVLDKKCMILVCEGLDTYAGPYINNQLVGVAFNMFQRYTYDVSRALQPGLNHIVVFFKSPVVQAANLASYLPYPVPPNCPPSVQHGECHINMLRKVQCAFGWDWGPSFPTQGIWKSIHIKAFDTAVMYGLTALPKKASDGSWSLSVEVAFDTLSEQPVSGTLTLSLGGIGIKSVAKVSVSSTNKIVRSTLSIPQDHQVELWWPNGYGKQTLYPLSAVFVSDDGSDVSNRSINVGFRTVELIQDPVSSNPSQGKTFYFKINGVPVFLKGTNWIPPDSFQERITRSKVEQLLQSAADVHANAIRINGVGVYESEDFYDLADQYGLMVWQDLMYCDALYPSSKDFLDSVTTELDYQLARIKHHPSIIIWSANNENEEALRFDWYKVKSNYQRYYKDYVALYETTIMPLVKAADDTRPFVPSCPSNGDQSIQEGFVATDPESELWGDKHYYNYSANLWDPNTLPIPRMMTEYGTQAWCSLGSLEAVFAPEDMDYWSNMSDHRQHHPDGNPQMLAEVLMHFNMPPTEDKKQKFADLIYLTQINQAMSIRTETEHYRRWQSRLGSDGRGLTMGALYWQLNDIWQAPTWASIEYSGKWKMLHYYVQHFLAPILVSPFVDASGNLDIYVVVDEILVESFREPHTQTLQFRPVTRVDGAGFVGSARKEVRHLLQKTFKAIQGELTLSVFSWSSFQPLKTWTIPYKLNSTGQSVFRRQVGELLQEAGCPGTSSCFVTAASSAAPDTPTWLPLTHFKAVRGLAKANVTVTQVQQTSPMEFRLTLSSDHVTPFVWLDAGPLPGRFGDNGFLMTSATHSVTFQAWAPTQTSTLQQSLSVLSLMDIYDRAK